MIRASNIIIMWWKLVLLTIYLAVLFVLSRILEAVTHYQGGYLPSRLLDPVSLSVRRLKALLDQRGVSYTGVVERHELTELVQQSGDVIDEEVETAVMAMAEECSSVANAATAVSTNFTCGSHFYEEVEDLKDSVWVVQVIRDRQRPFVSHRDWKAFVKKVSRFGVQTGIFDCSFDHTLCDRKNWYKSQLILAMPQGYRAKDHVIIRTYTGSSTPQSVFDWVSANLASRVHRIRDIDRLHSDWYQFQRKSEKVRVILLSAMKIPPMFFSVLSVKFTGRVKFGAMRLSDPQHQKDVHDRLKVSKVPVYKVVTPEEVRTFGTHSGEYLSYQSMALLLRTLHPEVNDIFLLSLIIVNLACSLELFITRGGPLKRIGRALWCTVKWNFLLILLWLPVLGLFQLPYVDAAFDHVLTVLRVVGMTQFASCVRADWLWYSSVIGWLFLVVTFLMYALVVGWLHHLYGNPDPMDGGGGDEYGFGRLLTAQWESYLSTIFQPSIMSRHAWMQAAYPRSSAEVGMELLIERLAVPNLWLQPVISSQYIHNLPVWKHCGPCRVDSDVGSDPESSSALTEDHDSPSDDASMADTQASAGSLDSDVSWLPWFGQRRPLMFVCERCRALQTSATTLTPRSEQELEQERLESESACAKYLMDGNYRCMCGLGSSSGGQVSNTGETGNNLHHHRQRHCSRTQSQHPVDQKSERNSVEDFGGLPPGIIPMTDCSICLESYKYGTVLCGLPCGHSFHQQCIMGWLSRDNHCCPICRWPAYKAKPCNMHQHCD